MFRVIACFFVLLPTFNDNLFGQTGHSAGLLSSKSTGGTSRSNSVSISLNCSTHTSFKSLRCISIKTEQPKSTIVLIVDVSSMRIEGMQMGNFELYAAPLGCLAIASVMSSPKSVFYVQNRQADKVSALLRVGELESELKMDQIYFLNSDGLSLVNLAPSELEFPDRFEPNSLEVFLEPKLNTIVNGESELECLPQQNWVSKPFIEQMIKSRRQRLESLFGNESGDQEMDGQEQE